MEEPLTKVLLVVGPTASGKSSLGVELASRLGAEIVGADSQQIYRHFDIGTAKPTADELRRVRHHLVSEVEPHDRMTAGRFAQMAAQAIADIHARSLRALVVGGAGLYLRALLYGVAEAPPRDDALRRRLQQEAADQGREALHRRLAEVDPETAAKLMPRDLVRVVRALEIHALTGERPAELLARHGFKQPRYRALGLAIAPPREHLYRRIDVRTLALFEAGLVDEVRSLSARGFADAPVMQSVGYRQALACARGEMDLRQAVESTAQQTRRYAKRQLTWLRSEPWVEWLPWPLDLDRIAERAERFLESPEVGS